MNFFKKIKNQFNYLIKDFKEELRKIEENQNKEINKKIDKFNKDLEFIYEKKILKELKDSQEELKELKERVKKIEDIEKKIQIPKIDKDKYILFYSDDHPGALFQIYNDIRVILEKRTHIVDIDSKLEEKIKNFPLQFNHFNLIPFKTEEAPYYINYFLKKGIIPDAAILDIVYGGIILEDNKFKNLDGIDIGKTILEKNPKSIVTLYTSCSLNIYTYEGRKLNEILNKFKDRILFVDKDINDQHRIEIFYNMFEKLLKYNYEKFEKLKAKDVY